MDLNRGSWFAKHGGARLRFGAVPGGRADQGSLKRGDEKRWVPQLGMTRENEKVG